MTAEAGAQPKADAFLGGKISLVQSANGPRAGLDAVFLAAACPARADDAVLDAGAGAGGAAFCLAARVAGAAVTGIEINPHLAALFRENARRNGMENRARIIEADLTAPFAMLETQGVSANSFDHAICNPPFFEAGKVRAPADEAARRANILQAGDLERWIKVLAAALKPRGTVTLIHETAALPQLLALLERRFGAIAALPLFPRSGQSAIRILVQGVKGSRAPFRILPGLTLHAEGHAFTPEADAVLRGGGPVSLI